jgi:2-methylisocitrate lyase-like PEP mutase family enzyme
MERQSTKLRALLRNKTFLHMPSVYDAIGGRLCQSLGYEAAYIGGYVSGGATAITEGDFVKARQDVEDIISLNEYYEIEEKTVEARQKKDEAS